MPLLTVGVIMEYIRKFSELEKYFEEADFTDVKVFEGETTLRKFIASMLSFYPSFSCFANGQIWVKALEFTLDAVTLKPSGLCNVGVRVKMVNVTFLCARL